MSVFNRVSIDSVKADIVKNEIKITFSLAMSDENLVVAREVATIFDEDTRAKVTIVVQGEHQTTFVDSKTGEILDRVAERVNSGELGPNVTARVVHAAV